MLSCQTKHSPLDLVDPFFSWVLILGVVTSKSLYQYRSDFTEKNSNIRPDVIDLLTSEIGIEKRKDTTVRMVIVHIYLWLLTDNDSTELIVASNQESK